MKKRKIPWNVIVVSLMIITILVGTYVAYDINKKTRKNYKVSYYIN